MERADTAGQGASLGETQAIAASPVPMYPHQEGRNGFPKTGTIWHKGANVQACKGAVPARKEPCEEADAKGRRERRRDPGRASKGSSEEDCRKRSFAGRTGSTKVQPCLGRKVASSWCSAARAAAGRTAREGEGLCVGETKTSAVAACAPGEGAVEAARRRAHGIQGCEAAPRAASAAAQYNTVQYTVQLVYSKMRDTPSQTTGLNILLILKIE